MHWGPRTPTRNTVVPTQANDLKEEQKDEDEDEKGEEQRRRMPYIFRALYDDPLCFRTENKCSRLTSSGLPYSLKET